ncbi:hypothetical protein BXZ70DRAFT_1036032 [Cristinia sonorae]|uniref:Peptidase M20 dimerisation domain-containing protein n=1 Tax=Cristinia sonorae TaxID=1940300 RepID=A0A8K0UIG2_9AGAR|nr:hypothetical protein BXZ70DRAFT_1036032 [Cristinia sonorae]
MQGNNQSRCFPRLFTRKSKRNDSLASTSTIVDEPEPLSPSDTFVEKHDQALHSTCLCSGPWTYPSHESPTKDRGYSLNEDPLLHPDIVNTIHATIDQLSPSLRQLSIDIWDHPEHGFEERYAHDVLTRYIAGQGFTVTKHYLGMDTAWRAEYSRGKGGRVIGVNSEMDALPGLGHACGHNLIAVSGIAVAVALKAAIDKHNVSARIILLGTPAEEFGGGKIRLLERGAYKEMDVCVMSHPGPGKPNGAQLQPWMALQNIEIEFTGHSAHAAFAPWEAQNALDAAFLAYSSISVLRQQIKPTCRVHGIVTGRDWEPNVIPDYAKMRWIVRAPTFAEVESLRARVTACFEAAALATGCKLDLKLGEAYHDVRQSPVLGDEFARILNRHLGMTTTISDVTLGASSDWGLVSYTIPSIQPVVNVQIQPNGGNHTPQFAETARTPESHEASMKVAKGLAMTAFRVIDDQAFFHQVKQRFEEDRKHLPQPPSRKT